MIKNNSARFKKVGIIVLNFNGWQDTIECLESLQKIEYPDFLIIVVDNASSDGSIEKIKAWAEGKIAIVEYERECAEQGGVKALEEELQKLPNDKKIVLIKNNTNLGYSAGNNVGIKYALKKNVQAVLITNPDVLLEQVDILYRLVDTMFSDDDVVLVGPKVIDAHGKMQNPLYEPNYWGEFLSPFWGVIRNKMWRKKVVELSKKTVPIEVNKIVGCCLLIRATFLTSINLLDENVFLYCEEAILAAQAKRRKKKIIYDPRVKVIHNHRGSYGDINIFLKSRNYYLRNYKNYGSIKLIPIRITQFMIKLRYSLSK